MLAPGTNLIIYTGRWSMNRFGRPLSLCRLEFPGMNKIEHYGECPVIIMGYEVFLVFQEPAGELVLDKPPVCSLRIRAFHAHPHHDLPRRSTLIDECLVLPIEKLHASGLENTGLHVDPVHGIPEDPDCFGLPLRVEDPHVGPAAAASFL